MHTTLSTTADFIQNWDSRINFLMAGEFIPFSYAFPSTEDIVARLLEEEATTAITGEKRETGDASNVIDSFRGESLDDLSARHFQLRYPDVTNLDAPGGLFEGIREQVIIPWKQYLLENDFEWDRCYVLARVSGPDTCTGYHMDRSNVLFWNVRGRKLFHGFKDPDRWAPIDRAMDKRSDQIMPEDAKEEDLLTYDVGDNAFLWNHLLTPHWVDAPELTFGINFSHGGLRHKGRMCRFEEHVYDETGKNPNESWHPETSSKAFLQAT